MKLTIDTSADDQRLDRFIRKRFPGMSRSEIYRLLRTRPIRRDSKKLKENDRIYAGDVLDIPWPDINDEPPAKRHEVSGDLTIVASGADFLVAFKPVGLKTIPDTAGEQSLSLLVQTAYDKEQSDTFRISPLSRLDRNTAGLVLFGRSYQGLKKYNELMRSGAIRKYYYAIIFGTITETTTHHVRMQKDPQTNRVTVGSGVMTSTRITPIISNGSKTLVELELITGKSHQIRALLQSLGHPIEGDPKYGRGGAFQWLVAYRLVFEDQDIRYLPPEYLAKLKKEFNYVPGSNHSLAGQQLSI